MIWKSLGIMEEDSEFWGTNGFDWVCKNIRLSSRNGIDDWNALFCVSCWLIWRRRNELVHHNTCPCPQEGVAEIRGIVNCMKQAKVLLNGPNKVLPDRSKLPSVNETCIRIYVDGAYCHGSAIVGCGGILQSGERDLIEGFTYSCQGDASVVAELWGCIWGLRRAWELGYRQVDIFCDASEVVVGVNGQNTEFHKDEHLFALVLT